LARPRQNTGRCRGALEHVDEQQRLAGLAADGGRHSDTAT
jgi:hypothetical protein